MKNKLYTFLCEQVLQVLDEISIKQLKEKYPELEVVIAFAIKNKLPNKYFEWYVTKYKESQGRIATQNLIKLAKQFDQALKSKKIDNLIAQEQLPKGSNDINFWMKKPISEFVKVINLASETKSRSERKEQDVIKFYDDGKVAMFEVLTKEAVCLYGAQTRWCITEKPSLKGQFDNDGDEKYKYHYEGYKKGGIRFIYVLNPQANEYKKLFLLNLCLN